MEIPVTRSSILVVFAAATVLTGLSACSKKEESTSSTAPAASQAAPATQATAPAPAPQAAAAQNSGKVLQVEHGGGYTYAEVQTAAGPKVWIAGSQIPIKVGDTVEWGQFAVMRDFNAKSLNRTFPEILFVNQWAPSGTAPVAVAPHGTFPQPPAPGMGTAESGTVKSVANAGGYSYIEVDRGGQTVWVAAMETPMKPGDKVQWQGGTEMRNFTAKSLGRTFDKIIFAQAVNVTQ